MPIRRHHAALAAALFGVALSGCESGGHFTVLGYTTKPNYDTCIKTVYVPIFQCQIMLDETRRQIPFDVTRAVIREIEAKTPYKVISDRSRADTELTGTVVSLTKNLINRNQLNEIREAETLLTVGIVWKDLRSGEILSKQRKAPNVVPTPGIPALDIPDLTAAAAAPPPPPPPPGGPPCPEAAPVLVTGLGDYIPELGQSTTTAYQQSINKLAVQIVSLMEKPW
ncbi:MAG TPA: LPS assembly lipoprotein LptE [Gemmataceae bacterium]|jgi:hypothetical protein